MLTKQTPNSSEFRLKDDWQTIGSTVLLRVGCLITHTWVNHTRGKIRIDLEVNDCSVLTVLYNQTLKLYFHAKKNTMKKKKPKKTNGRSSYNCFHCAAVDGGSSIGAGAAKIQYIICSTDANRHKVLIRNSVHSKLCSNTKYLIG